MGGSAPGRKGGEGGRYAPRPSPHIVRLPHEIVAALGRLIQCIGISKSIVDAASSRGALGSGKMPLLLFKVAPLRGLIHQNPYSIRISSVAKNFRPVFVHFCGYVLFAFGLLLNAHAQTSASLPLAADLFAESNWPAC